MVFNHEIYLINPYSFFNTQYNILIQAISIHCQEGHFWNCIWSWNQSAQNAEFSISNKHFLSSFQSMHWYLTWTTNLLLIGNNFVKFWILKQFFANFKQISSLLSESLFMFNSSNALAWYDLSMVFDFKVDTKRPSMGELQGGHEGVLQGV